MSHVFHDVACQRCGCVCDDLVVHVEENRLVDCENVCFLGEDWWREHEVDETMAAKANGEELALSDAVSQAAILLKSSRAPLVCVGSECGIDSQRAAIELAEAIGGTIGASGSALHEAATQAFQTVGQSAATLGELRNRADLFVFWRSDPLASHPRFLERFVELPGRFVPQGKANRRVIVIDDQDTATAQNADQFLKLSQDQDLATICVLRAAISNTTISGKAAPEVASLAEAMTDCQYGVVCIGDGVTQQPNARQVLECLNQLVQELNERTRFVTQVMGGPASSEVLTWQTGFPMSVNFAEGVPRYRPAEATAEKLLERGEVDCLVMIGDTRFPTMSKQANDALAVIPAIAVGSKGLPASSAAIRIATAVDGIHRPAVTFRMDGIAVPLRAVLDSSLPSQAEILRDICEAVQR